jgi:hypothetical protein
MSRTKKHDAISYIPHTEGSKQISGFSVFQDSPPWRQKTPAIVYPVCLDFAQESVFNLAIEFLPK